MSIQIKEGDVVELKSGGPRMTVNGIQEYQEWRAAFCGWFDDKELKSATFNIETLVKCPQSSEGVHV